MPGCLVSVHSVYDEIKARERELVESYERAVVEARHRVFRSRVFTICPPQSTGNSITVLLVIQLVDRPEVQF